MFERKIAPTIRKEKQTNMFGRKIRLAIELYLAKIIVKFTIFMSYSTIRLFSGSAVREKC